MVISDELNHASIIDAIRLATVIKKGLLKGVYKKQPMEGLRQRLEEAARTRRSPAGVGGDRRGFQHGGVGGGPAGDAEAVR